MGKQTPGWAFFTMGLNIAVAQGLLIRLLLVSYSGNELSIGLVLGNWMLAEALGSYLSGRLVYKLRDAFKFFVFLQMVFAITLWWVVCACYLVRRLAKVAPGEALGFASIFWTSLLMLAPLSAVHGAMFSIGCATYGTAAQSHTVVGRLYISEALGAMSGGIILTFVFIPHLKPIQIGLLLAFLGLATALLLLWSAKYVHRPGWAAAIGLTSSLSLYLLLSPQAFALHRFLTQQRWGKVYPVVYDHDSPYGNIAVTQLQSQYTFLANGTPILTVPFPDIASVEETVHLPLLFHPAPHRILVISGGVGGILRELFKYNTIESVDYAELDPSLIAAVRAFPTMLTGQELQDPRLYVHTVDGRLLLHQMVRQRTVTYKYDVVLVNLPYPSTLELNRFYTEEFFQLVQQVLDERGLAIFILPGSLTYVGPGMRDLNLMLRNGLQAIFANVRPIPGDMTLWLASSSLPLTSTTIQELIATWQKRALSTSFITTEHLQVRFSAERLTWFQESLQTDERISHNRDLHPVGVLYGLAYWSEIFAPTTSRLLASLRRITLWQWCLSVILLAFIMWLVQQVHHARRCFVALVVVATTGFTGMICDLILLFAFQSLYGYVYQYIGLITAAFMAGLALGGWATTQGYIRNWQRVLMASEIALITYGLILPLILQALSSLAGAFGVIPVLMLLNALGGWLVGLQFPLSSWLFLSVRGEAGYAAGLLYAADLIGAFLGAIAAGIALLPVLGTTGACLLVVTLKMCSLALLMLTYAA